MKSLKRHGELPSQDCLKWDYERKQPNRIKFYYNIELGGEGRFYVNENFLEKKTWGLWKYDVIEFFIRPNSAEELYYEIEISPLNQQLVLGILKPREVLFSPLDLEINSAVEIDGKRWKGEVEIQTSRDLINPKGNVTSILGKERRYYAARTNPESKVDFHKPEYFFKL